MSNNEIIPGFDEIEPQLDSSWLIQDRISWKPLSVSLERHSKYDSVLIARISGELEAFNGSYLGGRLRMAIETGTKCLCLDMENTTLGDYREVLVLGLWNSLKKKAGVLLLKNPPVALKEYWKFVFGESYFQMIDKIIVATEAEAERYLDQFFGTRNA